MTWLDETMVGFDTETTGVSTAHDRIVTAAILTRTGGETTARTWLIDPGVEIPARATEVHGITTAHARKHGVQPSTALEEIASILAAAMGAGFPLVAFNAQFDLSILESEARSPRPAVARLAPARRRSGTGGRSAGARSPPRPLPTWPPQGSSTCASTTASRWSPTTFTPLMQTWPPPLIFCPPWPRSTARWARWSSLTSRASRSRLIACGRRSSRRGCAPRDARTTFRDPSGR
ncbi:exonuclease domain-containing protein [Demequina litorisediminis]|uniref:exonuclease domain-containing protein n=1 Tax=Demequina litorisediminis TaxID=1849022 RepID=UPI0024E152CF|nr:exonuclease domain-containing protein [Demequina litorisediminis]